MCPARIARLRARDFLDSEKLLAPENFAVDYALCPEQVITEYIARLVDFPEALQVLSFGGGSVVLVGRRAYAGGLLVGSPIKEMRTPSATRDRRSDRRHLSPRRRDHADRRDGDRRR
jgi:trk system potassium uptake protein TrkA